MPLCSCQCHSNSMSASTFTRSHGLYPRRWCDPFELNTSDGQGWMLLDLPGAPCDVTQPGMRTMSQRLRKAQECAAAGGKYGLLQAVLLSLDSQPATPAQWVREAVALEACSRVLLPEAHQAPLDLDAARAAYQQLTPAEQRLWRQLQAARTQLQRNRVDKPGDVEGYDSDECHIANVLGGVTGDVNLLFHEMIYILMLTCRWDMVCLLVKRYRVMGRPETPTTMQIAYNWALACYHQYGPQHLETQAALAATQAADPQASVPLLLSGLAYPPPALPPASVPGNAMEAVGYCWHFGAFWSPSSSEPLERQLELMDNKYTAYSPSIKWLLRGRGFPVPTTQQQRDVAAVRVLVCGNPMAAKESVREATGEALILLRNVTSMGDWRQVEERGAPRLLRALVITAAATAVLKMNLPPLAAAPRLWEGLSRQMGYNNLAEMAISLKGDAEYVIPCATTLIHWYNRPGADPAAAARLGFWNSQELGFMFQMAPFLSVAAARWKWQCGDAAEAYSDCCLEPGTPVFMLRGVLQQPDEEIKKSLIASGMLPPSVAPLNALVTFLSQQKAKQRPGTGLKQLGDVCCAVLQRGGADATAQITQLGDPQEQALYRLFPGWLDQLVSQVTGRRVTLVIEPAAADSVGYTPRPECKLYLREAASGRQQVFGWRQPGDADHMVAHKLLMEQAASRGCADIDLQWHCAGVEPYVARAAPSSGASHGSSSSSSSRQQAQQTSAGTAASGATAAAARAGASRPATQQPEGPPAGQQASPATPPPGGSAGTGGGAGSTRRAAAAAEPGTGFERSSGGGSSGSSRPRVKPSRPCAQCGELFPKLKQCSRCKAVAYCSRDCQVAHWKAGHKEACQVQPAG